MQLCLYKKAFESPLVQKEKDMSISLINADGASISAFGDLGNPPFHEFGKIQIQHYIGHMQLSPICRDAT